MTAQMRRFEPTAEKSSDFRRALGCYGTGVTVITVQTPQGPLGMTANSFSSISLDPPLVLWSPAVSSRRHDAFVKAPHFCIHVLGADQLDLAQHFATNGDGFDAFPWQFGPFEAPTLQGCLAEFHCDTHALHPAGDHTLVLGRVRQVSHHDADRAGLLFDRGQFGQFKPHPDGSRP